LLQVVRTLSATGRLAGRLHGGQEQADERANDGDDCQEFHERETVRVCRTK
jgi:hypothetical protein